MADLYSLIIRADTSDLRRGQRDLDNFGGQADETRGGVDRLGRSFNLMKVAVIAAASVIGGLSFGRVINDTAKFGSSIARLGVVSGAAKDQMADLETQARELGATTLFTAQQTAQAQTFLAQAGLDAQEILQATPGILQLATAATLDLAAAADLASNVLSGFGLEVGQLTRVNDVLAATAASANVSVEQLGQSLSFAAPLARTAGISIEETAAAIGALGDAGLQGSRAGTGLLGVIRQLSNVTPQAEEALSGYGLALKDVDITTRGLQPVLNTLADAGISVSDSFTIFGSEANTAASILAATASRVDDLTKVLREADGTAANAAETMGATLSGSIASLNSAFSESILQIGDSAGAMQSLIDATTGVISVYNEMLPQFVQANDLTSEQAGNLQATAIAIQSLSTGIATMLALAVATRAGAVAQIAFNIAARANPYALLAAGAVALVTALIKITNQNDDLVRVFERGAQSAEGYEAAQMRLADLSREINKITQDRLAVEIKLANLRANENNTLGEGNADAIAAAETRLNELRTRYDELTDARRAADLAASQRAEADKQDLADAEAERLIAQNASQQANADAKELLRKEELAAESQHFTALSSLARTAAASDLAARREERSRSIDIQLAGIAREVNATVMALQTEQEIVDAWYEESRNNLDAANEQELAIVGGHNEAMLRLEQEYQERLAEIDSDGADNRLTSQTDYLQAKRSLDSQMLSSGSQIADGLASLAEQTAGRQSAAYQAAFLAQQAFALASILVNTQLASIAALAPPPIGLGPIAGVPYAAAIETMGAVSAGIVVGQTLVGVAQASSGAREMGGQVQPNSQYLVGERGPEIISMGNQPGHVTPNHQLDGGQPVSVTNVFQISTGVEQTVQAEIERYAPLIEERSRQGILKAINSGGAMSRATGRRA